MAHSKAGPGGVHTQVLSAWWCVRNIESMYNEDSASVRPAAAAILILSKSLFTGNVQGALLGLRNMRRDRPR